MTYAQDIAIKPPRARAAVATVTLGACALILAVQAAVRLWTVHLIDAADVDGVVDAYTLLDALVVVQYVSTVTAGVVFVVWLWRARSNAEIINEAPQHWGRPWLILGWIIPILNLWVPQRIVGDIWRSSASARRTILISAWWVLYVLYFVGGRIAARVSGFDSMDAVRTRTLADAAVTPIGIAAAVLAIAVIWRVTRAQRSQAEHIARLLAHPGPSAPGADPYARTGPTA